MNGQVLTSSQLSVSEERSTVRADRRSALPEGNARCCCVGLGVEQLVVGAVTPKC